VTGVFFGVVQRSALSRSELGDDEEEAGLRTGTPGRHRAMQLLVLTSRWRWR
jgi:hypothetical protein